MTSDNGRILFGVCTSDFDDMKTIRDVGYDYAEMSVGIAFDPTKSDAEWAPTKEKILAAALPVRACNGFLPGTLRLTGPDADFPPALEYAATACRRADEVGCQYIVFGSGGARNVPAGFQIEEGRDQFADFCGQLAKAIAGCKVTVVIEPLRPSESNIVQYVWQGMQIVEEVNSPRIQQLADIYHMMMGREPAESILRAGSHLRHCHVACNKTRAYPGSTDKAELVPYFDALFISEEIGVSKPSPAYFDECFRRLSALAGETILPEETLKIQIKVLPDGSRIMFATYDEYLDYVSEMLAA